MRFATTNHYGARFKTVNPKMLPNLSETASDTSKVLTNPQHSEVDWSCDSRLRDLGAQAVRHCPGVPVCETAVFRIVVPPLMVFVIGFPHKAAWDRADSRALESALPRSTV